MEDQPNGRHAEMVGRLDAMYEAAQSARIKLPAASRRPFNYEMWTFFLIAFVMLCQFVVLAGQSMQAAELRVQRAQIACLATAEPLERPRCIQ